MSPHYHWTEFAYNSCRVPLAAWEATKDLVLIGRTFKIFACSESK